MVATAVILFGLLLLAVALGAYVVALYNALVGVRHQVDQAWSNIDVLLKQRHDELPMLIEVVKGHAGYERELLERITTLRARTGGGSPDAWRLSRRCRGASGGCSPPPKPIRSSRRAPRTSSFSGGSAAWKNRSRTGASTTTPR